jgi:phytoene dehydrogenase-like protein
MPKSFDVTVIGAGPNGLAAAIELARAGWSVCVIEANDSIGGGARSEELTLPGFIHDVCSAVHPLAAASPFFLRLPLKDYGLEFLEPPIALAHPFDDGSAAVLYRSLQTTTESLGRDGSTYNKLIGPLVDAWTEISQDLLAPIRLPKHPWRMARFGFYGMQSIQYLTKTKFKEEHTRALFAGLAAHSFLSLNQATTSAFALMLATTAHVTGWPIARGGSQKVVHALAGYLRSLGGTIVTGSRIRSLSELPKSKVVMCDVTPRQLVSIAGEQLPSGFRRKLMKYRYGPGAFKVDWALSAPVPWKSALCRQTATVHLGGSFSEIAASEEAIWKGDCADHPFLIVCQPSLFDPTRAPTGQHTLWAYCHVPNGSRVDMTERIEQQFERFAPGFRQLVIERSARSPEDLERHNANLIGGDINGGVQDWRQLFTRPTFRAYSTPVRGLYICSSSTPPGGGVHGMCGYHAARRALREMKR